MNIIPSLYKEDHIDSSYTDVFTDSISDTRIILSDPDQLTYDNVPHRLVYDSESQQFIPTPTPVPPLTEEDYISDLNYVINNYDDRIYELRYGYSKGKIKIESKSTVLITSTDSPNKYAYFIESSQDSDSYVNQRRRLLDIIHCSNSSEANQLVTYRNFLDYISLFNFSKSLNHFVAANDDFDLNNPSSGDRFNKYITSYLPLGNNLLVLGKPIALINGYWIGYNNQAFHVNEGRFADNIVNSLRVGDYLDKDKYKFYIYDDLGKSTIDTYEVVPKNYVNNKINFSRSYNITKVFQGYDLFYNDINLIYSLNDNSIELGMHYIDNKTIKLIEYNNIDITNKLIEVQVYYRIGQKAQDGKSRQTFDIASHAKFEFYFSSSDNELIIHNSNKINIEDTPGVGNLVDPNDQINPELIASVTKDRVQIYLQIDRGNSLQDFVKSRNNNTFRIDSCIINDVGNSENILNISNQYITTLEPSDSDDEIGINKVPNGLDLGDTLHSKQSETNIDNSTSKTDANKSSSKTTNTKNSTIESANSKYSNNKY